MTHIAEDMARDFEIDVRRTVTSTSTREEYFVLSRDSWCLYNRGLRCFL